MMKDQNNGNVYDHKNKETHGCRNRNESRSKKPLSDALGREDARRAKTITDYTV